MKIGNSIIIFFLSIVALAIELFLYIYLKSYWGKPDYSGIFISSLMGMTVAAGILAPFIALLGVMIKNQKLSLVVYVGLLIEILVGIVIIEISMGRDLVFSIYQICCRL